MSQNINHPALLPGVLAIARQAGAAIMGVYAQLQAASSTGNASFAQHKQDGSPLTQADLLAHQAIAAGLARLTPHLAVVSEEDAASLVHRLPTGDFWLIDPLDGTKEFLACNGEFTVNIALIQNGISTLGVVLAPALGLAYWGSQQTGAFKCTDASPEAQAIRVKTPNANATERLRVLASKSHMNADTEAFLARLKPHELVQAGSSLKFCRVAEGSADLYPRLGPTCEWDTAAAQAVVQAAGGCVLQLDGAPLRYGKPNVLNPYFIAAASTLDSYYSAH